MSTTLIKEQTLREEILGGMAKTTFDRKFKDHPAAPKAIKDISTGVNYHVKEQWQQFLESLVTDQEEA